MPGQIPLCAAVVCHCPPRSLLASNTVTSRPELLQNWRIEPNLSGRVALNDGGMQVAGMKINIGDQVSLRYRFTRRSRTVLEGKVDVASINSDGETSTESLRSVEGGIFRGRLEAVTRPFTFSVAAGDDSSSIRGIAVRVVPPPALTDLSIRLIFPPYTTLAPQTRATVSLVAMGGSLVGAPVKTRLRIGADIVHF